MTSTGVFFPTLTLVVFIRQGILKLLSAGVAFDPSIFQDVAKMPAF